MAVLFVPRVIVFAAATLAGSGQIVRATYTVPAGKRAEIRHTFVEIDASAAAAATAIAFVRCTIAGTAIRLVYVQNAAVLAASLTASYAPAQLDLSAGDTVDLVTTNNAGVNVTMVLAAGIREYQ